LRDPGADAEEQGGGVLGADFLEARRVDRGCAGCGEEFSLPSVSVEGVKKPPGGGWFAL